MESPGRSGGGPFGAALGKGKRKDLDLDEELSLLDQERSALASSRSDNEREQKELAGMLSDLSGELADLERGLARYPASSMRLKEALTKKIYKPGFCGPGGGGGRRLAERPGRVA